MVQRCLVAADRAASTSQSTYQPRRIGGAIFLARAASRARRRAQALRVRRRSARARPHTCGGRSSASAPGDHVRVVPPCAPGPARADWSSLPCAGRSSSSRCCRRGAVAAVVLRRPAPPPSAAVPAVSAPASDAGLTDDEVFSASMARLAEARRRADEEAATERVRADASSGPSGGADAARLRLPRPAERSAPPVPRSSAVSALLRDQDLAGALRAGPRPLPGALAGRAPGARAPHPGHPEPGPRRRPRPGGADPCANAGAAHLGGLGPLRRGAGARAPWRSPRPGPVRTRAPARQARAALALDESTPEAYLALGEYQFQDNDLAGAARHLGARATAQPRRHRARPGGWSVAVPRPSASAAWSAWPRSTSSSPSTGEWTCPRPVRAWRSSRPRTGTSARCSSSTRRPHPGRPLSGPLLREGGTRLPGRPGCTTGRSALPSAGANAHVTALPRDALPRVRARALPPRHQREGRPAWLNEGFADLAKLAADPGPAVRCTPDVHLFPLRALEGSFGRIGEHRRAHLAYLEGRHAVERIIERHGQAGVRADPSPSCPAVHPSRSPSSERSARTTPASPPAFDAERAADTSAGMNLRARREARAGERLHCGHRLGHRRRARRRGRRGGPERAHRGAGEVGGRAGPDSGTPVRGCAASPPTSGPPRDARGWSASFRRWTSW